MLDFTAQEWTAIVLTLRVALVAALVSLPLGVFAAYGLARWRFPGMVLVDGVIHLPLTLPPVVTGYLLLLLFGRHGPFGAFLAEHFGIVFAFRWTGAALAAGVMGFPLMVRSIRLAIDAIDRGAEEAAAALGAPPWAVFATVTLPLAVPGILSGVVLAFGRAMGEFGATITFVSNIPGETQTIASAIYALTQFPEGDTAALRLSLLSIAISLVTLIGAERMSRRATRRLHGR